MTYDQKLNVMDKLNRIRSYILWTEPIGSYEDLMDAIRIVNRATCDLFKQ